MMVSAMIGEGEGWRVDESISSKSESSYGAKAEGRGGAAEVDRCRHLTLLLLLLLLLLHFLTSRVRSCCTRWGAPMPTAMTKTDLSNLRSCSRDRPKFEERVGAWEQSRVERSGNRRKARSTVESEVPGAGAWSHVRMHHPPRPLTSSSHWRRVDYARKIHEMEYHQITDSTGRPACTVSYRSCVVVVVVVAAVGA